MVTAVLGVAHTDEGPYDEAKYADGNDPVQESDDATEREAVVGERRIHTFVSVQIDEHQHHQQDDEVA